MYVQLTTKCNMRCSHCGFACTEVGEDMTLKTFHQTLQWCDEFVCLGGGEPTLHPNFEHILIYTIANTMKGGVSIITNGKIKSKALLLARLAKNEIIDARVSQDEYHEEIDEEVYDAFMDLGIIPFKKTFKGIYNTTASHDPIKSGRCKDGSEDCLCPDMFVKPNGDIKICGCLDSPVIGSVYDDDLDFSEYEVGECYKNQPVLCK